MTKPLAIGIDIRLIGKNRTGDEAVFFQLVRELIRRKDANVRYELYTDEQHDEKLAALRVKLECLGRPDIEIVPLAARNRFSWNAVALPWRLFRFPVDVFHTQYILPLWLPRKLKVVTHIHDVSFRAHPEWVPQRDLAFLSLLIPRTIFRSDAIIAISEFTRSEILRYYPAAKDKVWIIENAAAEEWFAGVSSESIGQTLEKFGLEREKYFISSGTMQPRKNIAFLIALFESVAQRESFDFKLVLTGNTAGHNVDRTVTSARPDRIVFTGYVSDAELRALVAGSRAFVFPSLYEGFGIPIEEALASGVPVLAADIPAFREVGRDRVTYFNPSHLAQAAETLYTFSVADPENGRGEAVSAVGKRREKGSPYSWKRSAEKLFCLYRALADQPANS